MLSPGTIDINLHQDDRGYVYCAFDSMNKASIKRTYFVENLTRGQVRAWHLHQLGDTYFHVVRGAIKAAALQWDSAAYWDEDTYVSSGELVTSVLTERKPQLFRIPAGWYNGFESLTDNTKILVYSTLSFDEVKKDDGRLEWHAVNPWGSKNR